MQYCDACSIVMHPAVHVHEAPATTEGGISTFVLFITILDCMQLLKCMQITVAINAD